MKNLVLAVASFLTGMAAMYLMFLWSLRDDPDREWDSRVGRR